MASCAELRVDARGHVADKPELGVGDVEFDGRGSFERGEADELFDCEAGAGGRPGIHTLFEKPHAVDGLVEADTVADRAEVGEVVGKRCGRVAGRSEQRADERPGAGADVGPALGVRGNAGDGRGRVVAGGSDELGVSQRGKIGQ